MQRASVTTHMSRINLFNLILQIKLELSQINRQRDHTSTTLADYRDPKHPEPKGHPATPTPEDGRLQRAPYSGLDTSRLELIRQRKTGNLSPRRKQLGAKECQTG
jgi:hypothetical protein